MRRRVIGATLTILGLLLVLFEPVIVVVGCADCVAGSNDPRCGCHEQGASDWWGLISYPPGWGRLAIPMLITGVGLVVTGIVLLVRARRSGSPSTAR
jgi:hypothetical protein